MTIIHITVQSVDNYSEKSKILRLRPHKIKYVFHRPACFIFLLLPTWTFLSNALGKGHYDY